MGESSIGDVGDTIGKVILFIFLKKRRTTRSTTLYSLATSKGYKRTAFSSKKLVRKNTPNQKKKSDIAKKNEMPLSSHHTTDVDIY